MRLTKRKHLAIALVLPFISGGAVAFDNGGRILLNSHSFPWTDPESGGEITMMENVYEGCTDEAGVFIPHDMMFEYVVENHSYDPIPGTTNGFSGFQLLFPGEVPELYAQRSPLVGGPWEQNAFSGNPPPNGAEWDASLPNDGIMPGEIGTFSFCTAERVDVVVESEGIGGGPAGWAHTWGFPDPEPIIDLDGSASRFVGSAASDQEVFVGALLTTWPTGFWQEGLDGFDTDGSGTWTFGDDLHVEGAAHSPPAIRDGFHDDFLDPLVLDLDDSLNTTPGNEPVGCDFESGSFCPGGYLSNLAFYDTNGNGFWDDGEDIVLDSNGDGIFGTVANIQTFIFHGFQSVPGEEMGVVGITCSDGQEVCKKAKYVDEDGDRIIEVGEPIDFLEVIQVHNNTGETWDNVVVEDRWSAEIEVTSAVPTMGMVTLTTKGKSEKVFLKWHIGMLGPGETANLVLRTATDLTPGGDQSYTECSFHEYNSGAVLKYRNEFNKQRSFGSGQLVVSVLTVDMQGDCDGDSVIDAEDPAPHDPTDPRCAGAAIDLCIDADGIASPLSGLPGNTEVVVGALLTNWPTGFDPDDHGIDSFDNNGNGLWTFGPNGDDIHIEGASPACPTGVRSASHVSGSDCVVLDNDGSLSDGQPVSCDFESGSFCPAGYLSGPAGDITFFDTNGDGYWDDGEDIILDVNGNGIFD